MKRIAIVGTSGAGKTTVAKKLSRKLNIPAYELDNLYWLPGWQSTDWSIFAEKVSSIVEKDSWIICGNYSKVREIIWDKADMIIWLDYSFLLCFIRSLLRSIKRIFTKQQCCNGNYETISRTFFSKNSILLWIIKSHSRHKKSYASAFLEERYNKKVLVRVSSPKQLAAVLSKF